MSLKVPSGSKNSVTNLWNAAYGGVVDILLAIFPWFVVRNLQLETREKVGLTVAMSLGALTGIVVVLRVFFQFVQGDFNFGMAPACRTLGWS